MAAGEVNPISGAEFREVWGSQTVQCAVSRGQQTQAGNLAMQFESRSRWWHPCSKTGMAITVNCVFSLTPVLMEDFASRSQHYFCWVYIWPQYFSHLPGVSSSSTLGKKYVLGVGEAQYNSKGIIGFMSWSKARASRISPQILQETWNNTGFRCTSLPFFLLSHMAKALFDTFHSFDLSITSSILKF